MGERLAGSQEVRGSSPLSSTIDKPTGRRPKRSPAGLSLAQVGQGQQLPQSPLDDHGTEADSQSRPPRTPREHKISTTADRLTPDLQCVVEAWPHLPEAIRAGILATIEIAQAGRADR